MTSYSKNTNNKSEKQALPTWAVATAIGVVVLILAVFAYRSFAPVPQSTHTSTVGSNYGNPASRPTR